MDRKEWLVRVAKVTARGSGNELLAIGRQWVGVPGKVCKGGC